jgi:hypothetical protein
MLLNQPYVLYSLGIRVYVFKIHYTRHVYGFIAELSSQLQVHKVGFSNYLELSTVQFPYLET